MDSHVDSRPDLALSPPSPEGGAVTFGARERPHAPDAQSVVAEKVLGSQLAVQPLVPVTKNPVSTQQAIVADDQQTSTTTSAAADENFDALDEEWVSKAKAIVEQTKGDPHIESRELSRAKADYLRIRYNKQIKVEDQQ